MVSTTVCGAVGLGSSPNKHPNITNGVFHETTCMLFYGDTPTCVHTYACMHWPVYRIYYVNMPIRVGIHICVGAGKRIVNIQTSLLTLYTPTNIYKYPII